MATQKDPGTLPVLWKVDDATGLAAVEVADSEVGRLAYQKDTEEYHIAIKAGAGAAAQWRRLLTDYRDDPTVVTLTDGATIAWDMSQGNLYQVTLGGNRTLGAPTNAVAGKDYWLKVIQDGTGSRTLTLNAVYEAAGGSYTPTATADHYDFIHVHCLTASSFTFEVHLADASTA